MKKFSIKNFILIAVALLVAGCSIWLPGFIMEKERTADFEKLTDVPADYYSGPSESIIKNASRQLRSEQCMQLITGVWDSSITPANPQDCTYTDFGMKTMTINHIQNLYTKGLYPCSLSSRNENWYSWEAKPYRALDTTFRTYAAYFWDITFTKFDGSETHRFIVSENGAILYAQAETKENFGGFSPKLSNASYLMDVLDTSISYSTYTIDDSAGNIITSVSHSDVAKAYKTNEISTGSSKAQKIQEQIDASSSFINDFEAFEPDKMISLAESGGTVGLINYSLSAKATQNTYIMILLPEKTE